MFGLGTQELVVVALIVVVIFGVNRLPKIGKSLGDGIREFRKTARIAAGGDDDEADK